MELVGTNDPNLSIKNNLKRLEAEKLKKTTEITTELEKLSDIEFIMERATERGIPAFSPEEIKRVQSKLEIYKAQEQTLEQQQGNEDKNQKEDEGR